MAQQGAGAGAARKGLSYSAVDALTAAAVIAVGAVMMGANYRIGVRWGPEGPQSGFFPFYIGVILSLSGAVVMLKALIGKGRSREVFVTWDRFRLVLMVLVPTAAYVLVIQLMGIYVASVVFIGAFMRVMGKSSWLRVILVSVATVGLLFWMFEVQFMIPLPKGPLEALMGY